MNLNKLWIQLSLAFAATVAVTMLIIALTTQLSASHILRTALDRLSNPVEAVASIEAVYARTGSFEDARFVIDALSLFYLEATDTGFHYTLLDQNGQPVQSSDVQVRQGLDVDLLSRLPIMANGQQVGTLVVRYIEQPLLVPVFDTNGPRRPRDFIPIVLFVIGVSGLASGVLYARTLAAPLEDLAATVRRFKTEPGVRVEPAGYDEVREVATAFNDMANTVEASNQLRQRLVADVAHELRTPLNQIQGALYAMLDDIYPLNKEEITRLLEPTETLTHVVNDLRESAQADAGQLPMAMSEINLKGLLQDVLAEFRQSADEKALHLQIAPPVPSVDLHVDRARLLQVLRNLVSNAVRHTSEGGSITLKSEATGAAVTIQVSDTGEGIPAEALPHIFERFYRVDVARSRQQGGTGIGLSITKSIVEAHGGTIEVCSTLGEGTTFTITLPQTPQQ